MGVILASQTHLHGILIMLINVKKKKYKDAEMSMRFASF